MLASRVKILRYNLSRHMKLGVRLMPKLCLKFFTLSEKDAKVRNSRSKASLAIKGSISSIFIDSSMQPRSESRDRRSRSPKTTPHSGARQRSRSPRPNLRDTRSLVEPAHLGDLVLQDIQDSLEASNNRLKNEARYLRRHLGLPTSPGQSAEEISGPAPLFFVEITPYSNKGGAKCKLPGCSELIRQGKYRLALCPGMDPLSSRYGKQSTGEAGPQTLLSSVKP